MTSARRPIGIKLIFGLNCLLSALPALLIVTSGLLSWRAAALLRLPLTDLRQYQAETPPVATDFWFQGLRRLAEALIAPTAYAFFPWMIVTLIALFLYGRYQHTSRMPATFTWFFPTALYIICIALYFLNPAVWRLVNWWID